MAAFYGNDCGLKKCTTFQGEMCSGVACAAFCALDEYYAYCGNCPEPQKNDRVFKPLNYGPGFVWRKIEELVPMKDAPRP
jgi:hypothetical protein